ncbi:unnamed protein product [Leuciscus chuanchicus]
MISRLKTAVQEEACNVSTNRRTTDTQASQAHHDSQGIREETQEQGNGEEEQGNREEETQEQGDRVEETQEQGNREEETQEQETQEQGDRVEETQEQGNREEETQEQGDRVEETQEQGDRVEETQEQGNRVEESQEQGNREEETQEKETQEQGDRVEETQEQGNREEETQEQGDRVEETQEQGDRVEETQEQGNREEETQEQGNREEETQEQGEALPMNKLRKATPHTVDSWGFDWLRYEVKNNMITKVWCCICRDYYSKTPKSTTQCPERPIHSEQYITGTANIKKDTANHHGKSKSHNAAFQALTTPLPEVSDTVQPLQRLNDRTKDKMLKLFDIAYNTAYSEQPFRQFRTSVGMEKKHGVDGQKPVKFLYNTSLGR